MTFLGLTELEEMEVFNTINGKAKGLSASLLDFHSAQLSTDLASDLVTRAGGALVVQAGTATSTRVRQQEQSFNQIDIDDGSATITVHAWTGDAFKASDAQRYEWHKGRWRVLKSEEPAH